MTKPYTVTRTITIQAPPQRVRALLDDFHEWPQWSPWEDLDPQMRRTYSGPDAGVGAAYAWEGNRKAGKGDMTITADTPEQVDIALRFEKPFKERNRIEFLLAPAGSTVTQVEWRMHGELSGFMRLFSIVRSMDSLIGPDFDKGLARLKRVAESG
ncbi:MAG TPA: SRPBCC family protein [Ornithinibacter sp.]|nr:SRPBCC family protein [Ornithinibacter sp.]